jgi:hypothetical protein
MAPSSSGLGLWLLKPATRVRIPSGLLFVLQREEGTGELEDG